MNPLIQFKTTIPLLVIAVALVWFALAPAAQAKQQSEDRGNGNSAAENVDALNLSTTGSNNTAHGWSALFSNTSGSSNTADGFQALYTNTTGIGNTANGALALFSNGTGHNNTANGNYSLYSNTIGDNNTATGVQALYHNTIGLFNTAVGSSALVSNISGGANTAIGRDALRSSTGSNNTAIGWEALGNSTGSSNTALGYNAGASHITGDGNVYMGQGVTGIANENNHTYIRNINTTIVGGDGADFVTVNLTTGLLGHVSSSRRYKENVKAMDKASEALFRLKPVTFRYKKEIDRTQALSFGLIAEEVAEANPNLVVRNSQGRPETVRYEAVNAMLLNEFLKEHATVQELKKEIAILKAGLQKVSAQVEVSRPAPRVASNRD